MSMEGTIRYSRVMTYRTREKFTWAIIGALLVGWLGCRSIFYAGVALGCS